MNNSSERDGLAPTGAPQKKDYSHAWRALRHRNFRLFFFGQSISLIGSWMTRLATGWLVYQMTKSPMALGAIGFAGQLPNFLLAPLAGVLVDRVDRRKLLTTTAALMMCLSTTLALLTLTHAINIYEIFAISILQGVVSSLDMPGRQSFFVRMVSSRDELSNAIAINSSMVNTARLLGPSLAGMLVALAGEGWCFAVDAASYLAVLTSLLLMRFSSEQTHEQTQPSSTRALVQEGWGYISGSLPIRSLLLLFAVVSLMGWPFLALMPIFAAQALHGGPHTMGFLLGALGVGSLGSALGMVLRRNVCGLSGQIPLGAFLFGCGLICFGLSHSLWLSLPLMTLIGYGMLRGTNATNTILQTMVDEKMRGRVMSYYNMAFIGMTPFGSLLTGLMARYLGAQNAVILSGAACIAGGLWFLTRLGGIRAEIRPIYERLGVLERESAATP